MGRTALELIGRGGLGYSFDPLVGESRDLFTESVKSFMFVSIASLLHERDLAHTWRPLQPCGQRRAVGARDSPLPTVPRPGVVPPLPPSLRAHPECPAVEEHHGYHV